MFKTNPLAVLASLLVINPAFAIQPVYDGEDGIKAKVFASNCLACHSSSLSGSDRRGAPSGIDYDDYETAVVRSEGAILSAVTRMNMPPSSSFLSKLNNEQKQALTNWKALGFPEDELPPIYSSSTGSLNLPEVYIQDEQGDITQKLAVEMALVPNQPVIEFELTHFHELEDDSSGGDHSRR